MADETRAIEPALTAEEWKRKSTETREERGVYRLSHGGITIEGNALRICDADGFNDDGGISQNEVTLYEYSLPALMALANAALPDGDPRKITHKDVNELLEIAKDDDHPATIHDDQLKQIAAKLTALLPPEG